MSESTLIPIRRFITRAQKLGMSTDDTKTLGFMCLTSAAKKKFGSADTAVEFLIYYLDSGEEADDLAEYFAKYINN